MQLSERIITGITTAEAKALATTGPQGVNVVPVSVVQVTSEQIMLYDFFMGKTVENILAVDEVSLACWRGVSGIQIKARARYVNDAATVAMAQAELSAQYPERVVRGVLLLEPKAVYSVSATPTEAGKLLTVED